MRSIDSTFRGTLAGLSKSGKFAVIGTSTTVSCKLQTCSELYRVHWSTFSVVQLEIADAWYCGAALSLRTGAALSHMVN
jgi:hypothetical protein